MKNKEYPEDEPGLSQEQFEAEQAKRQGDISAFERELLARPKRYFFIFRSREERDAAMAELAQAREYSEVLLQLDGWKEDPQRRERGLQLNFKHGQEGLKEKLKALFAGLKYQGRKIEILEDYAPDDIEGVAGSKVVEMPKRGEREQRREAA